MSSFLDVTEKKKLEEALRDSEEPLPSGLPGSRRLYLHTRPLTKIYSCESCGRATRRSGCGRNSRANGGFIYSERKAGEIIRELDLRVLNGQSIEQEQVRAVKGEKLTFHDVIVPLRSPKGTIIGVCTISRKHKRTGQHPTGPSNL